MDAYTQEQVAAATVEICTRLADLSNTDTRRFVRSSAGRPSVQTQLQTICGLKYTSKLHETLLHVIMLHGLEAERNGPGAFLRFVVVLRDIVTGARHLPSLPDNARLPTIDDIDRIIKANVVTSSTYVAPMLSEALRLAGLGGKVIVEKTRSNVPSVELVSGCTFDLEPALSIDFDFSHVRVCCIDGYVEHVSELHHLLEEAASAKEPCVLFMRGLSDDVRHTLKVNYDRGSLRVVPVIVRFDLEGMNSLVDVAVASGGDVVSHLKGELISNVRLATLPLVDRVSMFRCRVVIVCDAAKRQVLEHVERLRVRRASERVDDVASLLDARIRSMTPNHVVMRLVDDRDYVVNSQSIDYVLRAVRSAIRHGVAADGSPATTVVASETYAQRCAASLGAVGTCLA